MTEQFLPACANGTFGVAIEQGEASSGAVLLDLKHPELPLELAHEVLSMVANHLGWPAFRSNDSVVERTRRPPGVHIPTVVDAKVNALTREDVEYDENLNPLVLRGSDGEVVDGPYGVLRCGLESFKVELPVGMGRETIREKNLTDGRLSDSNSHSTKLLANTALTPTSILPFEREDQLND